MEQGGKQRGRQRQGGPGGARGPRRGGPPPPGLFLDVVLDPARERVPGAYPVVALRDEDEPVFRAEVEARARGRYPLRRRGRWHGELWELEPAGLVPPAPRRRRREADELQRWGAARPILWPGCAPAAVDAARRGPRDVRRLHARLLAGGAAALAAWIREQGLGPGWRIADEAAPLADPERDLGRVLLAAPDGGEAWVKLGRLSTHPADLSLRARVSFGREGDDDAAADPARLLAVAELGRRLFAGLHEAVEAVRARIERLAGGPVLATQPIAYWNAPEGGARFHHDAFAEEEGEERQLAVVFVQLDGESVWLALSIEDLAWRVRELVQWCAEGELGWLVEELEGAGHWEPVVRLAAGSRADLLAELALPGCGRLGPLVDRGPEFTTLLADAGHALVLHPGDALVLPNHGPSRTAMHAVFCGAPRPTHGLSLAIRPLPHGR